MVGLIALGCTIGLCIFVIIVANIIFKITDYVMDKQEEKVDKRNPILLEKIHAYNKEEKEYYSFRKPLVAERQDIQKMRELLPTRTIREKEELSFKIEQKIEKIIPLEKEESIFQSRLSLLREEIKEEVLKLEKIDKKSFRVFRRRGWIF